VAGEPDLYDVHLQRYNSRLYRISRAIVLDSSEASDVVQHISAQAYEHLRQFAGRAKFSTWLTKIAIHEALLRRQRRNRFVRLGQVNSPKGRAMALTPLPQTPEEQIARAELRQVLESAIDGLPERQRFVQIMRDIEGMSSAETADCLGTNARNVKVLLHRARAGLRKKLYELLGSKASDLFRFRVPRCNRIVDKVFESIDTSVEEPRKHARQP
jgi:RNA polymerase sigma-70 factor, ECF subfamily